MTGDLHFSASAIHTQSKLVRCVKGGVQDVVVISLMIVWTLTGIFLLSMLI